METRGHLLLDKPLGVGHSGTESPAFTLAVLAHRHGRGPDFLIHDSHLYDGVDERQVTLALALAAEVTDEEHIQYIVTLNTDTLSTAAQRGFNPERHIRRPRLTDDEEGSLFGFRFEAEGK
ncbi:DUF2326 domain-containing protein [Streptomyces sp. NPDC004976]